MSTTYAVNQKFGNGTNLLQIKEIDFSKNSNEKCIRLYINNVQCWVDIFELDSLIDNYQYKSISK